MRTKLTIKSYGNSYWPRPFHFLTTSWRSPFCHRPSDWPDPQLGALPFRLGNYELIECIGRGASGAVYRAQHLNLERTVAVKVLGSIVKDNAQAVDRFSAEMKVVGSLAHPHIVRATDAGEVEWSAFFSYGLC